MLFLAMILLNVFLKVCPPGKGMTATTALRHAIRTMNLPVEDRRCITPPLFAVLLGLVLSKSSVIVKRLVALVTR